MINIFHKDNLKNLIITSLFIYSTLLMAMLLAKLFAKLLIKTLKLK